MGADYRLAQKVFELQEPVLFDQAAPNQNQWYPVFNELNCRIYGLACSVTVNNETIEVRAVIDGIQVGAQARAAAVGTYYWGYKYIHPDAQIVIIALGAGDNESAIHSYMMEGRHVEIDMRKTTLAGAGNIRMVVDWGQL